MEEKGLGEVKGEVTQSWAQSGQSAGECRIYQCQMLMREVYQHLISKRPHIPSLIKLHLPGRKWPSKYCIAYLKLP